MGEAETHHTEHIIKIYNHNVYTSIFAETIGFNYVFLSSEIDYYFNQKKSDFFHLMPTKPFTIAVDIVKRWNDEESDEERIRREHEDAHIRWLDKSRRRQEEEEEEKQNKQINTNKIFKSRMRNMFNQSIQCFVL